MSEPLSSSTPAPSEGAAGVPTPWFTAVVAGLLGLTLFYPLYQWLKAGVVFYENGPDESSYLQYEFSRATQSVTRPGQFLVSKLHELGLPGGWINVALDTVAVIGFPLLARAVFRRLGWSVRQANLAALAMLVVPLLVLPSNPLVARLQAWNLSSGMVAWLNLPDAVYTPLWRTPEPQFSLMLVAAAMLLALRWRAFWPVYVVVPFTYAFVAIPTAFVALALQLRARWPFVAARSAGPLAASAAAVGAACALYYHFLVPARTQLIVVASHAPLWSFTATVAIAVYALTRHWIAPEHRFAALAFALAPLVGSNQQLASGHIPQPDGFEQYVGCLAVAAVVALALRNRPRLLGAIVAMGALVWGMSAYHDFRYEQAFWIRLPLTPQLLSDLRTDPTNVVVNDPFLSSRYGLLYPKAPMLPLAYERTFVATGDRYVDEYRCLKGRIEADYPGVFGHAFGLLDEAYAYGSQKYVMAHINRKTTFVRLHEVLPLRCGDAMRRPLHYYFLLWNPYEPAKSGQTPRRAASPRPTGDRP